MSGLCQLSTPWSVLGQAHHGTASERQTALDELLERYGGAVHAYLLALVRDKDRADDLFQEFALRLARGDFHAADPEKGRFRNYVKTALFHLVQKQQAHGPLLPPTLATNPSKEAALDPNVIFELGLTEAWRNEILERTWKALEDEELASGTPYYTILKLRAEQPDLDGAALLAGLAKLKSKGFAPSSVRSLLRRAREKFAEHIYQDIAQSLQQATVDEVSEELADIGLLQYCRSAVQKRRAQTHPVEDKEGKEGA